MSTTFPTSRDTWVLLVDNKTIIMAEHINDVQDAIVALETKVGADASGTNSLDYKIKNFWEATSPRKLFFYNNTAPTNWSTVSAGDRILGLKGGSTYTTGGAVSDPGWAITGWDEDTHNHPWYYNAGNDYSYTYNDAGSLTLMDTYGAGGEYQVGILMRVWNDFCLGTYFGIKLVSGTYGYTDNDTHTHTHSGTWRPVGAMGILAQFDG